MPVAWITYKGKRILYADYQGQQPEQIIQTVEEEAAAMQASPEKVLLLINFTDSTISSEAMQRAKELGKTVIEPKLQKSAMVGIVGLKQILLRGYNLFTGAGKNQKLFDTEEEAKEWLVQ